MARVRCVMMQKDEDLLLAPWIAYYGYQFGIENLTIFDNGSSLPGVIATLRQFESAGGHVNWAYPSKDDWLRKGQLVEFMVRTWDLDPEYDFVLPLDCDEFIALFTPDGLTCQRTELHAYLDGLRAGGGMFQVSSESQNVPGRPGWFYSDPVPKLFFAAGSLQWLDHGFHNGATRDGSAVRHTPLTYLHMHHKPFDNMREHSRRKLESFVDVNDREALMAYTGDGKHVARFLLIEEEAYSRQFDSHMQFEFAGFGRLMSLLGHQSGLFMPPPADAAPDSRVRVRLPPDSRSPGVHDFDPAAYLSLNLDVAASGHFGLQHYTLAGYAERRRTA